MSIQKIHHFLFAILIPLVAIFFLPLGLDWFELPKILALLFVVTLCAILTLFSTDSFLPPLPRPIYFFLFVYLVGQIAAYIFSIDRPTSLFGSAFRYQGIVSSFLFITLLLLALNFFSCAASREKKLFFYTTIVSVGIVSFTTLLSYTGLFFDPAWFDGRAYATLGNPNYLASFLIAAGPWYVILKKPIWKISGVIVAGIALFTTGTRSAWIALVIALLLQGIILRTRTLNKLLLSGAALGVLLTIFFLIGLYHPTTLPFFTRFSFSGDAKQSVVTRETLWFTGFKMYLARPWVGYGQDTIQERIDQFLPRGVHDPHSPIYIDRVHSEPEDLLLSGGPLSLIGYLGLFISIIVSYRQLARDQSQTPLDNIMFFTLVALFFYHLVNFSTVSSNILWYVSEGYLLTRFSCSQKPNYL